MICDSVTVGSNSTIDSTSIVQPYATIIQTTIGENNNIEDRVVLEGCTICHDNLIEVGCVLKSCIVLNSNEFQPRCRLSNCRVGSLCMIGAEVVLEDFDIPDNTSVFIVNGVMKTMKNDRKALSPLVAMYRTALTDPSSPQFLGKNFQKRS